MKVKRFKNNFELVKQKLKDVEEKDHVRNFQPPISGSVIMEVFDLKPCNEIGIVKTRIKEAILEGEIPNEYDAAFAYMMKIAESIGLKPKKN